MILNPKHGLNPTIRQCFWCGGETDEILLLGNAMKDEAPMHMITDYNPCNRCSENFNQGILIVEVSSTPVQKHQPDLNGSYPTGAFWVVTEDAIKRLLCGEVVKAILKARKAFITQQDAIHLGLYSTERSDQ